ncbi:MAG: hypothetical protein JXB30_04550 [Anaerolineae bacterium]|nr:hypothetical protein [Anaerolineae bacterium]
MSQGSPMGMKMGVYAEKWGLQKRSKCFWKKNKKFWLDAEKRGLLQTLRVLKTLRVSINSFSPLFRVDPKMAARNWAFGFPLSRE